LAIGSANDNPVCGDSFELTPRNGVTNVVGQDALGDRILEERDAPRLVHYQPVKHGLGRQGRRRGRRRRPFSARRAE